MGGPPQNAWKILGIFEGMGMIVQAGKAKGPAPATNAGPFRGVVCEWRIAAFPDDQSIQDHDALWGSESSAHAAAKSPSAPISAHSPGSCCAAYSMSIRVLWTPVYSRKVSMLASVVST